MEWIDVKDKLPDIYQMVLVFINASNAKEIHIGNIDKDKEFRVLDEYGNHAKFITHWMPLPEPPK